MKLLICKKARKINKILSTNKKIDKKFKKNFDMALVDFKDDKNKQKFMQRIGALKTNLKKNNII